MRKVKIITAILIVLIGTGSAWADLTDGLIAHWEFDEGSGTDANDSVGGNHGTLVNGPVWTTGQIGGALSFDGSNDYVNVPDNDDFTPNVGTVCAWIKLSSWGENNYGRIVQHLTGLAGSGNAKGFDWLVRGSTHNIAFGLYNGSSYSTIGSAPGSLSLDNWYHVAVVWDGTNVITYVDGSQSGTPVPQTIVPANPSTNLLIGTNNAGNYNFDGKIDDVRIYDKALTADQIGQLYHSELLSLEILGPDEVAENSQVQYEAIAHYDNGGTADVTALVDWSVEPNTNYSIATGLLTTETVDLPQDITISAEYTEGDITKEAQKQVEIFAICPSGSALKFDGENDYVDCGNGEILDGMAEITLSAWVYPTAWDKYYAKRIMSKSHYPQSAYELTIGGSGDTRAHVGFYGDEGSAVVHSSVDSVALNQWYHVATTNTGTEQKIYINGVEEGSNNVNTGKIRNVPVNLWIGQISDAYVDAAFDGTIDDVRVYNRALSPEDIQQIMHTKPADDETGLVGYWDFDEGEDQIAGDSAGGNDGQLGSTPDVDNSDPNWVDSDVPMRCTLEGLVERNLLNVLGMKDDALDVLGEAITKELSLLEYMDEAFKNRDFGNTRKGDVVKAKQKIHSAIQHEEQAETEVNKSIEKLDDAMNTLGL